ncbi:MAG: putative RNA-binding protein with PUA-like domain [Pseudoalteromonas tetraodonis]|jgi:predicted RNA-binding protein with PUA-like domain
MNYWLMKSEPDAFGIDDLIAKPNQTEHWDGVRNYQARNMMRDDMKLGDQVFFYHSSCKEIGVVGVMEVACESYPDHTGFDSSSKYYDSKSSEDKPRWFMIDVKFVRKFSRTITLAQIKANPLLEDMRLIKKGNRLSINPVTKDEWKAILDME